MTASRLRTGPRTAVAAVADLVLPTSCAGCGHGRRALCPACAQELRGHCAPARPSPLPADLPPTVAAARYEGAVAAALVAYKDRGRVDLARPLGTALAAAVAAVPGVAVSGVTVPGVAVSGVAVPGEPGVAGGRRVLLVPVPSAPAARRRRGHAHLPVLARRAAGALRRDGVDAVVLPCLRGVRAVADQGGLTAAERGANLAGALAADARAGRIAARACRAGPPLTVIVDDVLTTGSTLAEAARALDRAGLRADAAAVVAAAVLRRPPPRAPRIDTEGLA